MKKAAFALICIYLLIYIIPLGTRRIAIIDESRYAEIPREMIASGDWTVPHLNGLRYFEKPVMGYWLTALSMKCFGNTAFAIRLPSALAAGGTALLIFLLATRFLHDRKTALLAAAISLTFVEVCGVGVTSVLDSMLTFFVTGMLAMFFFAATELQKRRTFCWLLLCGLFAYCAFMTKGFLAFVVPLITMIPFLIWNRDTKKIFTLPWIPLAVAALLVLPWAWAIHMREPDFWSYFFWEEHINRFLPESLNETLHNSEFWRNLLGEKVTTRLVVRETQHEEAFWYFIPVLLLGALPWTFTLPAALKGIFSRKLAARPTPPLLKFALCWLVFPFLFFSASSGKLGTYILPCFPPLAIIMAMGLQKYLQQPRQRTFNVGVWTSAVVFLMAGLFFIFAYFTHFPEPIYTTSEWPKLAMLLSGLLFLGGCSIAAARSPLPDRKLVYCCLSPVLLLLSAHFALPNRLAVIESAELFLETHHERANSAILAADKYLTHSTCFFYDRDNVFLFDSRGEFEYGLSYPDSEERLMTLQRFEETLNDPQRTQPLVIVLDTEHYEEREEFLEQYKPSFREIDGKLTILQFD